MGCKIFPIVKPYLDQYRGIWSNLQISKTHIGNVCVLEICGIRKCLVIKPYVDKTRDSKPNPSPGIIPVFKPGTDLHPENPEKVIQRISQLHIMGGILGF